MTLSFPTRRSSDLVWARTSLPVTISSRTVANVKPDDQAMARGKEAARARRGSDRAPAPAGHIADRPARDRSEEHTSELQSLMRISYAVFCLKKKNHKNNEAKKATTINTTEM